MDIELARTFLEVVAAGNFVGAAERLNVTQSTVSTRIRSLEDQLGRTLFVRSKAGAALTPAGVRFERHATALLKVWEQARHEVALPPGYRSALAVGGQISLWDGFLLKWLGWMRTSAPDVALRAQFGRSDGLMRGLVEGTLDMAVMYRPQSRPGLNVELLLEDKLILVSTKPNPAGDFKDRYVYVDWGPEFHSDHMLNQPDLSNPGLYVDLGTLSLKYLTEFGGSGYFPRRIVRPYLEAGQLFAVSGAAVLTYPAYVVYPNEGDQQLFSLGLEGLRHIASMEA